jgi:hypothetical protein
MRTLQPPEVESRAVTVDDLIAARGRTVAEVKCFEALLGKARLRGRRAHRGGLVVRHLEHRERLKLAHARACDRLRTLNAAIKAARRDGVALLLYGTAAPADTRELVATLYRLYVDAVPPIEHDAYQQRVMAVAHDYVTNGTFPVAS